MTEWWESIIGQSEKVVDRAIWNQIKFRIFELVERNDREDLYAVVDLIRRIDHGWVADPDWPRKGR